VAAIARLSPAVLRLLAGGRPLRLHGQEPAPDVQLALLLLRLARHRGLDTMTPAAARAEIARSAHAFAGPLVAMARVEARTIPGPGGPLAARLYLPADDGRRRGLLVYYHGG